MGFLTYPPHCVGSTVTVISRGPAPSRPCSCLFDVSVFLSWLEAAERAGEILLFCCYFPFQRIAFQKVLVTFMHFSLDESKVPTCLPPSNDPVEFQHVPEGSRKEAVS